MSDIVISANVDSIERFNEALRYIAAEAKSRRRRKTPAAIRKQRAGRGGKTLTYVERPHYQVWLDDNLPGWSVRKLQCWVDKLHTNGSEIPILFSCAVELSWVDATGLRQSRVGVGSVGVSASELDKNNSSLLDQKYTIALTNAIKSAASWAGAFFDLRLEEEEFEPPTAEQVQKFNEIFAAIPASMKPQVEKLWKQQTKSTAQKFIENLNNIKGG